MKTSENINELAGALAKAQAEIKNAALNKVNPFFKSPAKPDGSRYADLAAVREAVVGPLSKNGIVIVQATEPANDMLTVITRLIHTSGQWIESAYPITNDTSKPQAMGSALTYARRYSISALCNIASEDDDDGNAASKQTNGNGHADLTGNPAKSGRKPAENGHSEKDEEARANAAYWKNVERQLDVIKTESDLDDWYAQNREELNARLPRSYVPTLKDRLHEMREEFALAGRP